MPHSAITRSACDHCRIKRTRCIRNPESTAPCARCAHTGAQCTTGAAKLPGRPRKRRLVNGNDASRDGCASASALAHLESSVLRCYDESPSTRPIDDVAVTSFDVNRLTETLSMDEAWSTTTRLDPYAGNAESTIVEQNRVADQELCLVGAATKTPAELLHPWNIGFDFDAAYHLHNGGHVAALDTQSTSTLGQWELSHPPVSLAGCNVAMPLLRLREKLDHRFAAIDAAYVNPLQTLQSCKEAGVDGDNPVASLLMYTDELIDIVQVSRQSRISTTGSLQLPNLELVPSDGSSSNITMDEVLSTENLLLVLSTYLALMRIYDALFHCMHMCLSQLPPEAIRHLKAKSVFRLGGITSLQDMKMKTYATGVLDVVCDRLQALEECIGVPIEYRLRGGRDGEQDVEKDVILGSAEEMRLFRATMAQEDIKPRRGGKSYAKSLNANMQDCLALLID